jgi:hypothetical protein
MSDGLPASPPGPVRGRPFAKGQSGNPRGRPIGSRNKATLAAAALLAGEAEALTRKAVELALAGDPTALRLCLERILPPCRERPVRFSLPPVKRADDITAAMGAVTAALAEGAITPGEAVTIATVIDTFIGALNATKRREFAVDPLQVFSAADLVASFDCSDQNDEGGGYDGYEDYEEGEDGDC